MEHTPLEPFEKIPARGEGDMVREEQASAPVGELYEHGMLEKPLADLGTPQEKVPEEIIPEDDAAALPDDERAAVP